MPTVRIPSDLYKRLRTQARLSNVSAARLANAALAKYLEDVEDLQAARKAIRTSKRTHSLDEAAKQLGLDT